MRQRDVNINQFFLPGDYDSPLTSSGRARTIAAFHLAQGNVDVLTSADMRRDVLSALMSASAVGYWLSPQGWLEKSSKVGAVQLLRLTDKGLNTCTNSVQGGSNVPTTRELVSAWRRRMLVGEAGWKVRTFPPLPLLEGRRMRTIGVKRLVELAILSVPKPYTEDAIEDVFLAIERNEAWLIEYEGLCTDLTKTVVNNWVGVWVSKYVGRTGAQQTTSSRSRLAGSYSKLTTAGSKLGGKRKEAEALQLMSDYYQAHKATLPANVRDRRSSIVELLMEGIEPKEAFELAAAHD